MLRQGIKLARTLSKASPISAALGSETYPGSSVSTDDEIDTWLAGVIATEYHPQGTCSMLPKALGGVVNPNLQVYGLANVRVADSSVFPISFATHLMSPTYGLAEKASDIIIALYTSATTTNSTTSNGSSMSSNSDTAPSGTNTATSKNSASALPGYNSAIATMAVSLAVLILSYATQL
ncbi:hypothetical protein H0H93_014085 [Arthromyces matolae]|nr:hypothetical protein H0H93_014085 [Arthromyces matolae]